MRARWAASALALSAAQTAVAAITGSVGLVPADLTVEYQPGTAIIDVPLPRFSWRLAPADVNARCLMQTAYEVEVRHVLTGNDNNTVVWASGRVAGSQQLHVPYNGAEALSSHSAYSWAVRVWGESACNVSSSSSLADDPGPSAFVNGSFSTAFMPSSSPWPARPPAAADADAISWSAPWVTSSGSLDHDLFRTELALVSGDGSPLVVADVSFARVYYVGLG